MYGCYDRPPIKESVVVFDGYWDKSRQYVRPVVIENTNTKECQYSLTNNDPHCVGCQWNRQAN